MQDRAIADRVDQPRDTAGVAVNVSFGVIGEDRGGAATAGGVVVDVATGFLQSHGRHVIGDADALAQGGEGGIAEQLAQLRLPGQHEGDRVSGVEGEVDHALDGGESGGGEILSIIDDDDRLLGQLGDGLEEQLPGVTGEERRVDLQFLEDRLEQLGRGQAAAAEVEGAVAVAVELVDEGGEGDRLAAADGAGEQQQVLISDAKGEAGEGLLVGAGGERIGGLEVLAERQAGEAEEREDLIMHRHRGAPWMSSSLD